MTPYQFRDKPSKMVKPPTKCKICDKDYLNSRALVQHTQLIHLQDYDVNG